MKKRYECLLALDPRGQEDSVKEIIERLESELAAEGADVEQVQKMDKRPLAYSPRHIDAAYYVNFIFEADPSLIGKLRSKFKLERLFSCNTTNSCPRLQLCELPE
jgi:small subunit ribosomal protein S6